MYLLEFEKKCYFRTYYDLWNLRDVNTSTRNFKTTMHISVRVPEINVNNVRNKNRYTDQLIIS